VGGRALVPAEPVGTRTAERQRGRSTR